MAAKKTLALKILVVVNATGRQGASVARAAAAIGYQVRAHVNSMDNLVAQELYAHKNIVIMVGSLEDGQLLRSLFAGAHRAFVNTLSWGDEIAIGRALADEAKRANIQHFIYSSMPDHSKFGCGWPALPLWSVKFAVERYIRQVGLLGHGGKARLNRTTVDRTSRDLCLRRHLQQQFYQLSLPAV